MPHDSQYLRPRLSNIAQISGSGLKGLDGTSIWVANFGSNNVTKLSSGGTVLGTFAVGNGPRFLAYDGANIWVANDSSNSVTKLKASTGAKLGTFAVGGNPDGGVAFDGANIWVTNSSSSYETLV